MWFYFALLAFSSAYISAFVYSLLNSFIFSGAASARSLAELATIFSVQPSYEFIVM